MGNNSANAYTLGVGLGLASYQASVNQIKLAGIALTDANPAATVLHDKGFLTDEVFKSIYSSPADLHTHLENVRGVVGTTIRNKSGDMANIYAVALLIALSEGQTTSPEWNKSFTGPNDLAHRGLQQAQSIISSFLSSIPFDLSLMTYALNNTLFLSNQDTAHSAVHTLRLAYYNTVLFSPSLP